MSRGRLHAGAGGPQRLLEAAERLFAAKGFAGASIGEITRAARVSRPVLYYHFGSKEGLFRAVTRTAAAAYEANLTHAAAGADAVVVRIRRVCWAHAVVGRELALLDAAGTGAPALGIETASGPDPCPRLARTVEVVSALVTEGIGNGELDRCDPTAAALALVGAAEVSVAQVTCAPDESPSPERVDRVVAVVLRGLVRAISREEKEPQVIQ